MKEMSLMIIGMVLVASSAFAGGPSLESDDLRVKEVLVFSDKIVLKLEGTINMITAKPAEEGGKLHEAKRVLFEVKDVMLVLPEPKEQRLQYDDRDLHKRWLQQVEEAPEWKDKNIFTQMWWTNAEFENGQLETITAHRAVIKPRT